MKVITETDIKIVHARSNVTDAMRFMRKDQYEKYLGHVINECKMSLLSKIKDDACVVRLEQDTDKQAWVYVAAGFVKNDKKELQDRLDLVTEVEHLKELVGIMVKALDSWNGLYPAAYWELKEFTERLIKEGRAACGHGEREDTFRQDIR